MTALTNIVAIVLEMRSDIQCISRNWVTYCENWGKFKIQWKLQQDLRSWKHTDPDFLAVSKFAFKRIQMEVISQGYLFSVIALKKV